MEEYHGIVFLNFCGNPVSVKSFPVTLDNCQLLLDLFMHFGGLILQDQTAHLADSVLTLFLSLADPDQTAQGS